ncbi:MAG TPA: hypothetical protein P5123_00215 [Spirochaetota bacterium]|nr:hypothetical protein [Spirochaetota bacterium]
MKIIFKIMLFISLCFLIYGCSNKSYENRVNINQINADNSNNYYYIFRDQITKERLHARKSEYGAFAD